MLAKNPSSAGSTPRLVAGLVAGTARGSDDGTDVEEETDVGVTVGPGSDGGGGTVAEAMGS